jgi:hypothetical protein
MSKDFFITQLKRLPPSRGLELNDSWAKIRCPVHNEGRENTPSLKINLDTSSNFRPGSAKCFACDLFCPTWDDFAVLVKLKKLDQAATSFDFDLARRVRNKVLGNNADEVIDDFFEERTQSPEIELANLWPADRVWRGISGKLLHDIGAKQLDTKYGPRLYLPCYINKKFKGGVTCRIDVPKAFKGRKYINDGNENGNSWITNTIFPYDYTKKLLRKKKRRVLFIGEGPRDALNPLQYDLPTVILLGGVTVWSQAKADLILSLEPDLIVMGFDPDEIGKAVTKLARDALERQVKCVKLSFPDRDGQNKADMGNMSKKRCLRLHKELGL